MYKFFGQPLKEIKSKQSGKVLFRFDTHGEFITSDEKFIERAIGFFDHIELEAKEVGERVKKTHFVPDIVITTKSEIKEEPEVKEEKPSEPTIIHCKKCNLDFDNRGSFLTHTRSKEHKEG